jgi:hypothetical protein
MKYKNSLKPTTLTTKPIKTLKEFTEFIETTLPTSVDKTLWFRGSGKSNFHLSPTLYRHPKTTAPDELISLEQKVMSRFNQRAIPFLNKPINRQDEWEVLFFIQHYGIPTRLLDWSENPYIALYFALTSAHYKIVANVKEFEDNVCVWVLDPVAWNRKSLYNVSFQEGILSVDDERVKGFKPSTPISQIPITPIAIFGTHNSPRIVSQRGVFTVFGQKVQPMEQFYIDDSFPQDCLVKLEIDKSDIQSFIISLTSIGFTDSVVFPDLEGLAKELKRFFDFNV